ncbi:MAG: hypothetical protein ABI878_10665 [Acidobacteriota bacterium]
MHSGHRRDLRTATPIFTGQTPDPGSSPMMSVASVGELAALPPSPLVRRGEQTSATP